MSDYDSIVLADSPVSYWKCDEPSGTLADSAGGGNPLTLTGAGIALGAPGIGDGSTALRISTNALNAAQNLAPAQTLSGTFSLEMWVNQPSVTTGQELFATRDPTDHGVDVQTNSSTGFHADIGDGTVWLSTAADATVTVAANGWYHVVYVVTATTYTIYVNGSVVGSGSWGSAVPLLWGTNHNIHIGGSAINNAAIASYAKVAGYSTALSAAQIANHYATARPGPPFQPHRMPQGV